MRARARARVCVCEIYKKCVFTCNSTQTHRHTSKSIHISSSVLAITNHILVITYLESPGIVSNKPDVCEEWRREGVVELFDGVGNSVGHLSGRVLQLARAQRWKSYGPVPTAVGHRQALCHHLEQVLHETSTCVSCFRA